MRNMLECACVYISFFHCFEICWVFSNFMNIFKHRFVQHRDQQEDERKSRGEEERWGDETRRGGRDGTTRYRRCIITLLQLLLPLIAVSLLCSDLLWSNLDLMNEMLNWSEFDRTNEWWKNEWIEQNCTRLMIGTTNNNNNILNTRYVLEEKHIWF